MNIEFDALAHEYKVGGHKVPGVTGVIRALKLMPSFPQNEAVKVAMSRGTRVHHLTERCDNGTITHDVDPELFAYAEQWIEARDIIGGTIIHTELRVASDEWKFAGTLDRAISVDGAILIIDIKTGTKSSWHKLQTAAYALAFQESGFNPTGLPVRRGSVYLSPDSFTIARHDSPRDLEAWKAAMVLHNWRQWNK